MKVIMIVLSVCVAASLACAGDIPVQLDGKTVTVKAVPLNRQITAADKNTGAQDTALACSFLYYGLLYKGDIQAAATLSTTPKATADKWAQYQDRMGVKEFNKAMSDYYTSKNVIVAELMMGDAVMLVVKTPYYTAGQVYVRQGDKWFVTENLKTDAGQAFGKILSMIQDDKIKF